MRGSLAALIGISLSFVASASMAAGPEQLDQLEPGRGGWQAEYFGTFSKDDENEQALEAMYGVNDRLAVGFEMEGEYSSGALLFETVAAKALYRLTSPDAPLGAGLQLQFGFDDDASLAEAEARLIVEAQSESWWSQANMMLRRSTEDGRSDISGAYAWSVQRSVANVAWLGLEGSGNWGRTSCDDKRCEDGGHFAGVSLTVELEPDAGTETEIGLAALSGIFGNDAHFLGRLFIQLTF